MRGLAGALLLTVFLRLPAFCWPVISDDEAIYDAMAQVVNQGGVMYRDVVDHKPPGLVYTYALVERLAGTGPSAGINAVHALGVLLALLTAFGLFLLARALLPAPLGWLPPALYGLASTAKCAYDGLAVNGEILMNAPTVFAVWAVVRGGQKRGWRQAAYDVAAGCLMGLAGLAKWQALVAGLAFPLFLLAPFGPAWLGDLVRRGVAWLVGLAVPLVAAASFFYGRGVLEDAWYWGGLFNLRYVADGPGFGWALQRLALQLAGVVLPSAILYVGGMRGLVQHLRITPRASAGLIAWAILSILAVGIGGRFFGHYFLQAELPLCILAAEPVAALLARAPRRTTAALTVPAFAFSLLALSPAHTRALFDSHDPNWRSIGNVIAGRSQPDEDLFIWGNTPLLYHFAARRMGSRFSFCNYLTGLSPGTPSEYDPSTQPSSVSNGAWPLLLDDLEQRRPALFLDTAVAGWKGYGKFPLRRYPALDTYVATHYRIDTEIDAAVLYRRID